MYVELGQRSWYYMDGKWEFRQALELLSPTQKVLEVGVGRGAFQRLASQAGYQVEGIELNPVAVMEAKNAGFSVTQESLDDIAARQGEVTYDAIVAFQVLEHVQNPREFLLGMLRNLRKGGRIILTVPNGAVMRKIDPDNEDLLNQPPHHISHWDSNVFQSLEKYFAVRLLSIHPEPIARYHVPWMVTARFRQFFPRLGRVANRLLFNKLTLWPVHVFVRLRMLKSIPGHTLLVEFKKVR